MAFRKHVKSDPHETGKENPESIAAVDETHMGDHIADDEKVHEVPSEVPKDNGSDEHDHNGGHGHHSLHIKEEVDEDHDHGSNPS